MKRVWRRDRWHWFWFDPRDVARELLEKGSPGARSWAETILQCEAVAMSKHYQVLVKTLDAPPLGEVAHLYISRTDKSKLRPWADFQRIKNDICGPTFTAVEVYPAEDELVDDVDMWHLWCLPRGVRMPFWIGNARGDDIEWTFPGLSRECPACRGSGGDGNTCPRCQGGGKV